MAANYQNNRSVKIATPFGPNVLIFAQMRSTEPVSQPFSTELELRSDSGDLDPDKILGKPLAVAFSAEGLDAPRYFHGLVTRFEQSGLDERLHRYRATVRPWFWFLTRLADCRIFQGKSVPEIFQEVCRQAGFSDFELRLGSYQPWEYCVQYRETDFNFLSRLLEHEGIFYFFEHSENKHVMVLADDVGQCKTVAGYDAVPYGGVVTTLQLGRDHLESWSFQKSFQSGSYAMRDYNFEQPAPLPAGAASISRAHNPTKYELYDYPAEATQLTSSGVEQLAKLRVQEVQVTQMVARGAGDAAGLCAGSVFKVTDHPRDSLNIQYFIMSTTIELALDDYYSGRATGTRFAISLEAVDAREPFRPARLTPKPMIHGTQTAVVVGPSGEEIYTDQYGRIKVQFHWDRLGKSDENSSCFIRVGQIWAGKSWGAMYIPRMGQEVMVTFLEGDPDRPIVIGSVYNGSNMPPFTLPDNKTQSGVLSRSSKGGTPANYNEFRFEDLKGDELVLLHAEKDSTIEVEHDENHTVGNDRSRSVSGNETVSIGKDRSKSVGGNEGITVGASRSETVGTNESLSIGGTQSISVGGSRTLIVGKDETASVSGARSAQVTKNEGLSVGNNRTQTIGENDSLSVGKALAVEAGNEISIVTGSASITLKQDGTITLSGNNITLQGDGDITIKAGGNVVVKGTKITQN
jgi:type VI secretion system secreted protein VgrG